MIFILFIQLVQAFLSFYIKKSVETAMQKKLELFKNELNKELDSRNSIMSHMSTIQNASLIRLQEQQFNARIELWRHFVNSSKLYRPLASILSCLNVNKIRERTKVDPALRNSMRNLFSISLATGNVTKDEKSVVLYKQKSSSPNILPLDNIRPLLSKELWEIYESYQAMGAYLVLEGVGLEEEYLDEKVIDRIESNAIEKLSKVWPQPHKIQSLRKGVPILVYNFIENLLLATLQGSFLNSSEPIEHIKKMMQVHADIDNEFQNPADMAVKAVNQGDLPSDILSETFKKVMAEFGHENKK